LWQKTWTTPKKFKGKWEMLAKKSDEKDNETENSKCSYKQKRQERGLSSR
jgi:hypothetical protein